MERTRALKPGSSLTSPQGPSYYTQKDLYVGGKIEVLSHHFVLLDADEYVFNYMESNPALFKQSNLKSIYESLIKTNTDVKSAIKEEILKIDKSKSGIIDRKTLVEIGKVHLNSVLNDHVSFLPIIIFNWNFKFKKGNHHSC